MDNELLNNNTQLVDELGNPVETQYVDEFGNPIDPSLIDENGNYIGQTVTQYVDEFGNPIDPSLIDENGNYIGTQADSSLVQSMVDENNLSDALNSVTEGANSITIDSAAAHQMDDKELFAGMVTFDYNNVPITDIVNSIILDAINKGASDIHFDPFDDGIKIRIRIDGELNDYSIVPLYVKKNMITRIKIISGMNITESRVPQDGAIRTELQNKTIDLRVSCLPTNMGEKIVVRIMDYSMSAQGIESLDFSEGNLKKVKKMLGLPNGIILVTGATGSGKSTTVYSMLQRLNVEGTNLITVEDPIEMNIGGVNQVQAQAEIGLDFATVLRSILRQDPDVIMIGEIRDNETARIAVRASITGHLVLSTIHTNNSLSTIERLTDMEVERYLLGSSLSGIISQKLARRLCPNCKRLRPTNDYEKETFKKALGIDLEEIYEPVGCPECSRGYRGRIAIHEVLYITQHIRDVITNNKDKGQLRSAVYGGEDATKTMLQDGLQKVVDGKTSFEEILKLIDLDDDLGTNSQLGLNDQLEAGSMQAPIMDSNMAVQNPVVTAPVGVPSNITSTQPININITPEMLSGLNLGNLVAPTTSDDDEDEEIVVKPIGKKKKKKKIVEVNLDDLETDDTEEIKEETPTPVEEVIKYPMIEDHLGIKEIILDSEITEQNINTIDEIDLSNNNELIRSILKTFEPNIKNSKVLNKHISYILDDLEPLYEASSNEGKVLINEGLLKIRSTDKINKDNINRINDLIKVDDNIIEELIGDFNKESDNLDSLINDIKSLEEIDLFDNIEEENKYKALNNNKMQEVIDEDIVEYIPEKIDLSNINLDDIIIQLPEENIDEFNNEEIEKVIENNISEIDLTNFNEIDIDEEIGLLDDDLEEIEKSLDRIELTKNANFDQPVEQQKIKDTIKKVIKDEEESNFNDNDDDFKIENILNTSDDDIKFEDFERELNNLDALDGFNMFDIDEDI